MQTHPAGVQMAPSRQASLPALARVVFCPALVWSALAGGQADADDELQVSVHAPLTGSFPACTHISLSRRFETVTAGERLFYREQRDQPFLESPLKGLNDAHSTAFDAIERVFYVCDSGNHRLVAFSDPASGRIEQSVTRLAEIDLERPHDVVFDGTAGWTYVLNPNQPTVLRFRKLGQDETSLELPRHLGYSRALTLVSGRLYVVGSTAGVVVEVEDFAAGRFRIHRSYGKTKDAPAGSWKTTGLVPNDADWFAGHWYVTSYFCPTYAGNTDSNENKLIRFRDWNALETGAWEDLSSLLPAGVVPYYLSVRDDGLYIAVFSHEQRGTHDKIYRLSLRSAQEGPPE